jgi:hypothetical protein
MMRADLAGNTLLTALDVGSAVLATPQGFYDSTNNTDQNDLYRISLSRQSQLSLQLSQMTGDADLQVLDQTGHQIYGSNQISRREESLTVDLAAGVYYINVANFDGAADYYLQMSNASTPPPIVVPSNPAPIVVTPPTPPVAPIAALNPQLNVLPPSGDLAIDALINPYGQYWDSQVSDGIITYSFYGANSGPYYGNEQVSELNAAIKASVREILKNLETYIDQRFVEVADTATSNGVIRYMFSNGGGGSNADFYAYSYYPHTEAIGSDVHLNPIWDAKSYASFSNGAGSNGYTTLIHETLHALGLKHPGNYDALSNTTDGPFLNPSQDHKSNTVMSYNYVGTAAITPLSYDIRALQYLYGAKANATSNSTYEFTAPMNYRLDGQAFGNPNQAVNQSIWDAGGVDTIDLSGSTGFNYHVDLRHGGLVTTQTALIGGTYTDYSTQQSFVAPSYGTWFGFGSVMENVVSSSGNDRIIANDTQNIFSGFAAASFGDDVLENTNGHDRLDLSSNQRSTLRLSNNAGDLVIDWRNGDSIKVKGYFAAGSAAVMQILIEGQAFIATATGDWQIV